MATENTEELSISDVYNSALPDEGSEESTDDSSSEETGDIEPDKTEEQKDEQKDDKSEDESDKSEKTQEDEEAGDKKDEKTETKDGDKQEYTKERFDGLMSAWQKDKSEISTLNERLEKLEKSSEEKPEPTKEAEIPSEIANADADTQSGFKLLMKSVEGTLSKREEALMDKVKNIVAAPMREEAKVKTSINKEVEELGVEFGKEFTENQKEIVEFAAKGKYQLGELRHAYNDFQKDKQIANLQGKLDDGKKTAKDVTDKKKKEASISTGNQTKTNFSDKFDAKRDGNKSFSELLSESVDA